MTDVLIATAFESKETSIILEKPRRSATDINDFDAVMKYAIDFEKVKKLEFIDGTYCITDSEPLIFKNGIIFTVIACNINEKTEQIEKLRIKLAYEGPIKVIRDFITEARVLFETERKNDMKGLYTLEYSGVCNPQGTTNIMMRGMLMFEKHQFVSNKTFDNIYLDDKEIITRRLDRFIRGRDSFYKIHGLPYTLGFMFYGIPGTGKTSCIKAIANATQRHIIQLKLRDIKTQQQLRQLFYSDLIVINNHEKNGPELIKIPLNKRFYVLDDIDCGITTDRAIEIQNTQLSTQLSTQSTSSTAAPSNIKELNKKLKDLTPGSEEYTKILIGVERKEMEKEKKEIETPIYADSVTMGDLLSILDGTTEQDGRIMCVTTNFPDTIDPALIRPGRIDIKVKFSYASPKSIQEMINEYYSATQQAAVSAEIKAQLSTLRITPATIIQCILQSENLESAINAMVKKSIS